MQRANPNALLTTLEQFGDTTMGDKGGSKDKGKKEKQKGAKLSPKERRKAQKERKNKSNSLKKMSD